MWLMIDPQCRPGLGRAAESSTGLSPLRVRADLGRGAETQRGPVTPRERPSLHRQSRNKAHTRSSRDTQRPGRKALQGFLSSRALHNKQRP